MGGLNPPPFPSLLRPGGGCWTGHWESHLPRQLAGLSFSVHREDRANQRDMKVRVPQRTQRRGARSERKPRGPHKSLRPGIRRWGHGDREGTATRGRQPGSQGGGAEGPQVEVRQRQEGTSLPLSHEPLPPPGAARGRWRQSRTRKVAVRGPGTVPGGLQGACVGGRGPGRIRSPASALDVQILRDEAAKASGHEPLASPSQPYAAGGRGVIVITV